MSTHQLTTHLTLLPAHRGTIHEMQKIGNMVVVNQVAKAQSAEAIKNDMAQMILPMVDLPLHRTGSITSRTRFSWLSKVKNHTRGFLKQKRKYLRTTKKSFVAFVSSSLTHKVSVTI
mmetsp:Transcript_68501/g.182728  ORF Transcript_68501/g.182728 Transcript_68501/m.182728 type:complete len:117 (-) Transcript_68501:505-855(-)